MFRNSNPRNRNPVETSNSGEYRGKLTSDEVILLEKKCSEFMDSIFKETNPVPTIEEIVSEVKLAYYRRTGERDIKRMKDDSEGLELKHKLNNQQDNTNFQNMNNSGVYRGKLTSDEKLNNTQAMTNSKNTSQNTNEISGNTIVNGGNTNDSGFLRRFMRKLFS